MENKKQELLALGSIVVLNGGYKKLMIIGRMQLQGKEEKLWDYLGVLYPEGYLGDNYKFLFNNEDISEVIFEGYSDLEDERSVLGHFFFCDNIKIVNYIKNDV